MTNYNEFKATLEEIRDYIDGRGLSFNPECGQGIRKLDRIAQQMLDFIEKYELENKHSIREQLRRECEKFVINDKENKNE